MVILHAIGVLVMCVMSTGLNAELLGQKDSRYLVPTPALILDLDAMEKNIQVMSDEARLHGIALRPHCKSHKCINIAKLQIKAGAIGVSCVTLSEAEVMAHGGISGILITSPVVSQDKIARLVALHKQHDVMVVVDNVQNAQDLAKANTLSNPLKVLIDCDIGQNRTGVKSLEEALELYYAIAKESTLVFVGIQAYGGHFQHIASFDERKSGISEQNVHIRKLADTLKALSKKELIITGGGTGSAFIDLEEQVYTELQVGSYLFMDAEYEDVAITKNTTLPFTPSLFVLATVVSSHPNKTIVDAGLKAFATENYKPRIHSGLDKSLPYIFKGDEHGQILTNGDAVPIGHVVEFLTSHCDPTVNLYDSYYCVRGTTLVDIWPIEARGH